MLRRDHGNVYPFVLPKTVTWARLPMLKTAFCQSLAAWSGPFAIQKVSTRRMDSMTWALVGGGTGWAAVAGTGEASRMDAIVPRATRTPRTRIAPPFPNQ